VETFTSLSCEMRILRNKRGKETSYIYDGTLIKPRVRNYMNTIRTQLGLFTRSSEKGSAEWDAFNSVRDTQVGMFRVATPQPQMPRYSNVVRIRRYRTPHALFPKRA